MAHIAIIGANIGGLPATYEIQGILQKDIPGDHRVTVLSNTAEMAAVPMPGPGHHTGALPASGGALPLDQARVTS